MAKQFSVTTNDVEYLFPSGGVMIVENGEVSSISFQGKSYPTESSIEALVALANTGGTEQVQLTVIRVNDSVQTATLQMSFPVSGFIVNDSALSGSSAVILFEGTRYYVEETKEAIEEAANAGGGVETPTLDEVLTQGQDAGGNGIVNLGGLLLSDGSGIVWRDTETNNLVLVTVANGVFVLQVVS